ncbi:hypothetical protein N1I86_05290 [Bacillus sp. FSL W8-0116]|uniref:hypothetical protein n=1 Tax=Bacillus sp. FSL W8-0116 TaxID=2978206 RepID=UPI0030F5DD7A
MSISEVKQFIEQRVESSSVWINGELYPLFNDNVTMSRENFINQIVFEVYYDAYLKLAPSMTLREFAKQNSFKGRFDSFESYYKKVQRDYQSFQKHKDNQYLEICRYFGFFDNIQLYDNIQYQKLSEIKARIEGHKLKKYQIFQLLRVMDYDVFESIKTGAICNSKKKASAEVIKLLNSINDVYDEIRYSKDMTYFEKGVQFFQLENSIRYEFFYRIIKLLRKIEVPQKGKGVIRQNLKKLIAVTNGYALYETVLY